VFLLAFHIFVFQLFPIYVFIFVHFLSYFLSHLIFVGIYGSPNFVLFNSCFIHVLLILNLAISNIRLFFPSLIGQFHQFSIACCSLFFLDFLMLSLRLHKYSLIYFYICPHSSPIPPFVQSFLLV